MPLYVQTEHFAYPFTHRIHVLAVVNDAALSMAYREPFEALLSVSGGIYPEVELLGHMIIIFTFFFFEEPPHPFPQHGTISHSYPQSQGSSGSPSLPTLIFPVFMEVATLMAPLRKLPCGWAAWEGR